MGDDPESALVTELRALAGPSAVSATAFSIVRNGVRVAVSYSGGSSSSVTLEAVYDEVARPLPPQAGYRAAASGALPAPRPLHLVLRPEHPGDVAAKGEGLSVEWQTGDNEFDARVYVETDVTDPAVLSAVLNEEVRAATLALMDAGFLRVGIDDGGKVNATIVMFTERVPRPERGRRAVDAFARLLGSLPALAHVNVPRPAIPLAGWTRLLTVIGVGGWALNVGYFGLVVMAFHWLSGSGGPPRVPSGFGIAASIGSGLVAGAAAWKAYGDVLRERVRGRSDAHLILTKAKFSAFGGVSILVFTVALIAAMASR